MFFRFAFLLPLKVAKSLIFCAFNGDRTIQMCTFVRKIYTDGYVERKEFVLLHEKFLYVF